MLPDDWLRQFEGRYSRQVPMARRTTWRIGGPAELLLDPGNVEELAAMVRALWRSGVDYRVLGGGSNLLVHDRGVRGVVLSLARMCRVRIDGCHVDAEAGADLHRVVRCAERAGLTGAEALAGIPGRIGGAVFGNSGGRYGDIGPLVASIDLLEPDGTLVRLRPRPGFFRYRQTDVGARIVVRATLRLEDDLPEAVSERTRSIRLKRRGTQPGWIGNSDQTGAAGKTVSRQLGCEKRLGLRKGLRGGNVADAPTRQTRRFRIGDWPNPDHSTVSGLHV